MLSVEWLQPVSRSTYSWVTPYCSYSSGHTVTISSRLCTFEWYEYFSFIFTGTIWVWTVTFWVLLGIFFGTSWSFLCSGLSWPRLKLRHWVPWSHNPWISWSPFVWMTSSSTYVYRYLGYCETSGVCLLPCIGDRSFWFYWIHSHYP